VKEIGVTEKRKRGREWKREEDGKKREKMGECYDIQAPERNCTDKKNFEQPEKNSTTQDVTHVHLKTAFKKGLCCMFVHQPITFPRES